MSNNFPKLHNAAWPGVVGKGEGSEPPIELDTMLDMTAAASVVGVKFDGVDLFLFAPHVDIDSTAPAAPSKRQMQSASRSATKSTPSAEASRPAGSTMRPLATSLVTLSWHCWLLWVPASWYSFIERLCCSGLSGK